MSHVQLFANTNTALLEDELAASILTNSQVEEPEAPSYTTTHLPELQDEVKKNESPVQE